MRYLTKPVIIFCLSATGLAMQLHKSGEIKKEVCSINKPSNSKYIERKPVLPGEISGINTFYLELPEGRSYVYKPRSGTVSLFLVTHGRGSINQGSRQFEVNNVNLFVPSVLEKASINAANGTLGILEIIITLNETEFESVRQQKDKLPYFVDYTKGIEYKENIKSAKTISRTILPENIIPRFCMGSVETSGPDEVGAHAHPMLEQLFFGLANNDCIVRADEAETQFKENTLLHIPLGSTHGARVEEGKILYYIWMDLFRSQEDMRYIKENHIIKDK